jgi:hypothetical protein
MDENDEIDFSNLMYKSDDNLKKESPKIESPKIDKLEKLMNQTPKKEKKKDTPEKPSEEDIINKRRLILLLNFYLLEFPEKLKTFKKINLEKKTLDELKDLQKEFDFCIGNQSNVKGGTALVLSGIQALEYVSVNYTPIQCNGLAQAISNDPESIDTIKHICLKHLGSSMLNTEPEHRLLYKLMTTALSLHTINSFSTTMATHNDEIIEKVNIEFQDL